MCANTHVCVITVTATILFTEEDRSALESRMTDFDVELLQQSPDSVDVRVFPVTMDEFQNLYASSMNIAPADQRAIDAIADPAECKEFRFMHIVHSTYAVHNFVT